MIEENFEEMPLEELGEQITRRASAVDDQILSTAEMICVARKRVETELAGKTTWTEWARQNIKFSESRRRDLQRVADSDDPGKELKRIKEMTRKRVEKHREKQKAKQAVPLQAGDDKSVKVPANSELGQPSEADSETSNGDLEERANEPSLRNDDEVAGAAALEGPDCRERLIIWAKDAPPEKIEKVWVYVQSLDREAFGSETEEVAAPAAA